MINKILKDRYQIISFIAEGGMAKVYYGKDIFTDREIAIKILKKEQAADPLNVARFHREAKACSNLMHENIVRIYDVDNYEDTPYIVMEYVKSKSLKEILLMRQKFSILEALDITFQLLNALIIAHSNGVIHRDIKPQNVLIKSDGSIKLADFGIAIVKDAPKITCDQSFLGSVHYVAPEITQGGKANERSDIYSLGITFFELLSGFVPYNGDNPVTIAIKHLDEPLPNINKIRKECNKKFNKVLQKACHKNPNKRYKNAKEFKKAIENLMRIKIWN